MGTGITVLVTVEGGIAAVTPGGVVTWVGVITWAAVGADVSGDGALPCFQPNSIAPRKTNPSPTTAPTRMTGRLYPVEGRRTGAADSGSGSDTGANAVSANGSLGSARVDCSARAFAKSAQRWKRSSGFLANPKARTGSSEASSGRVSASEGVRR